MVCLTAAALIVGREKAPLAGTASKLPFHLGSSEYSRDFSFLYPVNRRPCRGRHYMADQLYRVRSYDPVSISIAVVVLSLAAGLAGFIPARRAASIEPMEALRNRVAADVCKLIMRREWPQLATPAQGGANGH